MHLYATPLYPQQNIIHFKDLSLINEEVVSKNKFPVSMWHTGYKTTKNGISSFFAAGQESVPNHGKLFEYSYFGAAGNVFYYQDVGELSSRNQLDHLSKHATEKERIAHFIRISHPIKKFMDTTKNFVDFLNYVGTYQVKVTLECTPPVHMLHPYATEASMSSQDRWVPIPARQLVWERMVNFQTQNTDDIVLDLLGDITWSLGLKRMNSERLEKMIELAYQ